MGRFWRLWAVLVSLVVVACIKNDNTNINNNGGGGITGPGTVGVTSVIITSFPTGPLQLVCPAGSTSGQVTFAFAARVEPADASQQVVWSASGGQMSASGVLTATQAGTYTVRATSVADPTKYSEVSVTVVGCTQSGQAPVLTFTATPSSITSGQSSTLSWSCPNGVTLVKSGGWSGSAAISGSQVVSPATTTTYTLTCSNPYGSVTQSVTLAVTTATAQKPNITASRDLIWGTACPASGPSRSFVHSDIAISQWRTLDGQLVTLTDQESDDVTAVANSTNASGTARIIGTTAQGMADTVQVTVNPCPQAQFIVGTPPQLRIAGNGCTMVSATTPVSGGTIASVSGGEGVVQVTSGSTVTWTPLAVGTRTVTFTSTDGRTIQVPVTVVQCSGPTGQITGIDAEPEYQQCVVGSQALVGAQVQYNGTVANTAADFEITSGSSFVSVVERRPNAFVLGCDRVGISTITARPQADHSFFDQVTVEVVNPTESACPATIDYTPGGGSKKVGENFVLSSIRPSSWPSGCRIIWGTDRRDLVRVNGDTQVEVEGTAYSSGFSADAVGIAPGTAIIFARVIRVRADGRWEFAGEAKSHTWNITN